MQTELELPLILNYRPTLAEQVDAARRYQRTTRKFWVYRVISVAALGAVVWAILTPGAQLLIPVWLLLALFTWFDPLPLFLIWLSAKMPGGAAPYQATFDHQGVAFDVSGQRVTRTWARYSQVLETSQVFVLVYGGWAYSVIPRRAFADPGAQERFHSFVQQQIKKR
jgi:hypothetical protein